MASGQRHPVQFFRSGGVPMSDSLSLAGSAVVGIPLTGTRYLRWIATSFPARGNRFAGEGEAKVSAMEDLGCSFESCRYGNSHDRIQQVHCLTVSFACHRSSFMLLASVLAFTVSLSVAHAADPAPIPGLKDAQERHVAAVAKAKKDYDAAVKEASEALVASLKDIQAERTKAGDLDGAVKVRDLVRDVTTGIDKSTDTPGLQIIMASFGYYDAWQDVSQPTRKLVKRRTQAKNGRRCS